MAYFRRSIVGTDLTPWHGAWLCVLSGLGLSLLGLYAIDLGTQDTAPAQGLVSVSGLVLKQVIFLAVGLIAAAVVAVPHYRYVRLVAWALMWVLIGLLVFLLIPFVPTWLVHPRNGARAWIELGPVDFQPGELAKVAFVLVLADYLRYRENHRTVRGLVGPAVIAFIPAALITLQPDLGMALLFAPALFAMLVVAGAKVKHMVLAVVFAVCAVPVSYLVMKPHQRARIDGMIQMVRDPRAGADGINFQPLCAQMLAGAGELLGLSDAKTRALHKYNALPERHNDMILSVILTRFGMLGGVGLFFLYAMWFTGAYLTAAVCKDAFGQLVVVGLAAILFAQTFINIGMVLGILPIIGLTLPFVSYGGTSLVTVWLMTGLVFSVAMRRASWLARPTFEFDESSVYGEPLPQPRIAPTPAAAERIGRKARVHSPRMGKTILPDARKSPRFAGIATFCRYPRLEDVAPENRPVDWAIYGVPFDGGTTYRPGARFGPRAVRAESQYVKRYSIEYGVDVCDALSIADAGDAPVRPYDCEQNAKAQAEFAVGLGDPKKTKLLAVGGDHTAAYGNIKATWERRGRPKSGLPLIHFDSHLDTVDEVWGEKWGHASVFRRAIEDGLVEAKRMISIGVKGPLNAAADPDYAKQHGVELVTYDRWKREGDAPIRAFIKKLGAAEAYLTFDIDCVDPALAPGTGTPSVGGFTSAEALGLLRSLKGLNIVGADVVEVLPDRDVSGITALLASHIIFEILALDAAHGKR